MLFSIPFRKKPATPVEKIQRRAGEVAELVQDTLRHAPARLDGLKETIKHAPEKIDDLRESAGHLAESAGEVASRVRESVAQRAAASDAAVKGVAKGAAKSTTAAVQRVRAVRTPEPIVITTEDRGSKMLWFALGLLAGVILGLLLAPASGRRSRALLRDKAAKGGHKAAELGGSATGTVADLGRRAKGVAHGLTSHIGGDDAADDTVIADRVRTALGQNPATHALERINVTCADGVVTLHGPIVDEELQATIESVVSGVKGVVEVRSALLLEDAPEDSATFVG